MNGLTLLLPCLMVLSGFDQNLLAQDELRIHGIEREPGMVRLKTSLPRTTLAVQGSTELISWYDWAEIETDSNGVLEILNPEDGAATRFFRLATAPVVPATLSGRAYKLGDTTIAFFGDVYSQWTNNNSGFHIGSYAPQKTPNGWVIDLQTDWDYGRRLRMDFSTAGKGTFEIEGIPNGPTIQSGDFVKTDVPAFNTNRDGISAIRFIPVQGGGAPGMSYVIYLNGDTAGTFTVGATGLYKGTFTLTREETSAHLRLNYAGQFGGDFDDVTLNFVSSLHGPQYANDPFSGTQLLGNQMYSFNGMFGYW